MTATIAQKSKDQDLLSFKFVEPESFNSIIELNPSNASDTKLSEEIVNNDFANAFICHLIFYSIFCVSLVLHIFIDFGLGSVIKKIILQIFGRPNNNVLEKSSAFA